MSSSIGKGRPSTLSAKKSYHPREASGGVFNLFSPAQIKQFKECFTMIDTDGDGKINAHDLKETLGNLGQIPSNHLLTSLLSSRPGDVDPSLSHATYDPSSSSPDSPNFPCSNDPLKNTINFTQFLTLFGERLVQLDEEEQVIEAFKSFEKPGEEGEVDTEMMRGWLRDYGDKMSDEEIDRLFRGPFTNRSNHSFNYLDFAKSLRVNANGEMKNDALEGW